MKKGGGRSEKNADRAGTGGPVSFRSFPDRTLPAAFCPKLTIRNDFADSLNTAVVYYRDSTGAWTTRGWYVSEAANRGPSTSTSKPTMYLHSYLSGRNKISWGKGDITRVVMSKAFVYEDGETCPRRFRQEDSKVHQVRGKKTVV